MEINNIKEINLNYEKKGNIIEPPEPDEYEPQDLELLETLKQFGY